MAPGSARSTSNTSARWRQLGAVLSRMKYSTRFAKSSNKNDPRSGPLWQRHDTRIKFNRFDRSFGSSRDTAPGLALWKKRPLDRDWLEWIDTCWRCDYTNRRAEDATRRRRSNEWRKKEKAVVSSARWRRKWFGNAKSRLPLSFIVGLAWHQPKSLAQTRSNRANIGKMC